METSCEARYLAVIAADTIEIVSPGSQPTPVFRRPTVKASTELELRRSLELRGVWEASGSEAVVLAMSSRLGRESLPLRPSPGSRPSPSSGECPATPPGRGERWRTAYDSRETFAASAVGHVAVTAVLVERCGPEPIIVADSLEQDAVDTGNTQDACCQWPSEDG